MLTSCNAQCRGGTSCPAFSSIYSTGSCRARETKRNGSERTQNMPKCHHRCRVASECARVSPYGDDAVLQVVGDIRSDSVQHQLIDGTLRKFGHLNILVNNAGVGLGGSVAEGKISTFDTILAVNLRR